MKSLQRDIIELCVGVRVRSGRERNYVNDCALFDYVDLVFARLQITSEWRGY